MTDTTSSASGTTAPPPGATCPNCGTPLLGEHCHACGQPVKGLVRHFSSVLGDFFDTVLNIDARVPRTLWPLFARPGFLTCEYFAGRRVRYVSPVRLFFFLAILSFFVARFTVDLVDSNVQVQGVDAIAEATSVAEVERLREQALAKLAKAPAEPVVVVGEWSGAETVQADVAQSVIRETAEARIERLREAERQGLPPPEPLRDTLNFGDGPWDRETNPVEVSWLPATGNAWLNDLIGRASVNTQRLKDDPQLYADAILGAAPTTLFALLPLFALLLKLAYLFKRRLYMEHLVVALHSHAFLCLALLLVFLLGALASALPAAATAIEWLEGGLWLWMALYLLLMQKKVYQQGWPMTLLKYGVLGCCYMVLVSLGMLVVMLGSLVWM